MDALDRVWAYCGPRAAARNSTKGVQVHAVTWDSWISGAMDSECGVIGKVPVGDWQPGMPHACPECERILAAAVPVVAAPAPEPSPMPFVSRRHRIIRRRRPIVVSPDQVAAELSAA